MNKFLILKYGQNDIANILLKYNYQLKVGDILAGNIIGKERTENLINLGLKKASFLPYNEIFIHSNNKLKQTLRTKEIGEFLILYANLKTGVTIVSFRRLHYLKLWERIKQINLNNMIFFAYFKKRLRGGKLVEVDKLNTFIPNFHLPKYYRRKKKINNVIGIKILEIQNKKHYIIGSSRLAIFKRQSLSFYINMKQKCCVTNIKSFGIFLNIYGLRCLLHISELQTKKIKKITDHYKKGDQINVRIIYINHSNGKIAVSMK
jgi:ribosomal protein S1